MPKRSTKRFGKEVKTVKIDWPTFSPFPRPNLGRDHTIQGKLIIRGKIDVVSLVKIKWSREPRRVVDKWFSRNKFSKKFGHVTLKNGAIGNWKE